jgi:hypothetical protein
MAMLDYTFKQEEKNRSWSTLIQYNNTDSGQSQARSGMAKGNVNVSKVFGYCARRKINIDYIDKKTSLCSCREINSTGFILSHLLFRFFLLSSYNIEDLLGVLYGYNIVLGRFDELFLNDT